ncbi:MAG: hypothetical protein IPH84_10700 [Bacteroidales bacterium]|nr:hypothetical protein [Bacteroidales bacterium]
MKNRDRSTEVADLKAVAHLEDYLVLFIDSEDQNIPTSLCVQANFDTLQFGPVQPMGMYLESNSYHRIHDGDMRISYRQRIVEEMNPEVVSAMLKEFSRIRWLKLERIEPFKHAFPEWEPGG